MSINLYTDHLYLHECISLLCGPHIYQRYISTNIRLTPFFLSGEGSSIVRVAIINHNNDNQCFVGLSFDRIPSELLKKKIHKLLH